jgi:hypothetical protein
MLTVYRHFVPPEILLNYDRGVSNWQHTVLSAEYYATRSVLPNLVAYLPCLESGRWRCEIGIIMFSCSLYPTMRILLRRLSWNQRKIRPQLTGIWRVNTLCSRRHSGCWQLALGVFKCFASGPKEPNSWLIPLFSYNNPINATKWRLQGLTLCSQGSRSQSNRLCAKSQTAPKPRSRSARHGRRSRYYRVAFHRVVETTVSRRKL